MTGLGTIKRTLSSKAMAAEWDGKNHAEDLGTTATDKSSAVIAGDRSTVNADKAIIAELIRALEVAGGFMRNAKIDLEIGAPKATAIRTISGGINMVRDVLAIAKAEGR